MKAATITISSSSRITAETGRKAESSSVKSPRWKYCSGRTPLANRTGFVCSHLARQRTRNCPDSVDFRLPPFLVELLENRLNRIAIRLFRELRSSASVEGG